MPDLTLTKRVVVLAPMQPELKVIVKSFGLRPATGDPVFSHTGSAGRWSVSTLVTGMGPALAREATQRALAAGTGCAGRIVELGAYAPVGANDRRDLAMGVIARIRQVNLAVAEGGNDGRVMWRCRRRGRFRPLRRVCGTVKSIPSDELLR